MSQALDDYRRGVRNLEWLQADDEPSPHLESMIRERLDEMWYELTDEEKEKAPRIPFRTNHDERLSATRDIEGGDGARIAAAGERISECGTRIHRP